MSARLGGFGKTEGLGERLAYWANQLGRDRQYPWVGTGLIDDLKCAAKLQGADFDKLFPADLPEPVVIPEPEEEEDEFAHFQCSPSVEYDL